MAQGTVIGLKPAEDIRSFVERGRTAFRRSDEPGVIWIDDIRDSGVDGVTIKRTTIESSPLFTIGEVTQRVGVVIPPHRHHESHVLLKVIQGAINVECEGFSRRVLTGGECLIPKGFNHTVYALESSGGVPAIYRSAHYEEWLTVDDNRFLVDWPIDPKSGQPMSELEHVKERISSFLSLQEEYLTNFENYRAWFYLLHYDQDQSLQTKDKTGTAGDWTGHQENQKHIREDYRKAKDFRVGDDLADMGWVKAGKYCSIFVGHRDKKEAEAVSPFHGFYNDVKKKWEIVRPQNVRVKEFNEEAYQAYMNLLTETFLPKTKYIIYITPPQAPGMSGFLERCQRKPYTSCIVGLTHGDPHFLHALSNYYLLCSALLQQQRFALRSDVTRVRYEEKRRQDYFLESVVPLLGED